MDVSCFIGFFKCEYFEQIFHYKKNFPINTGLNDYQKIIKDK